MLKWLIAARYFSKPFTHIISSNPLQQPYEGDIISLVLQFTDRKLRHKEVKALHNMAPDYISLTSSFRRINNLAIQGTLQAGFPSQGLCTAWSLCLAHSCP